MSYKVTLRDFEGPFDLLVYLIENAQMSIYDIRISEITSQYLAYIRTMKALDFNVTSDFMYTEEEQELINIFLAGASTDVYRQWVAGGKKVPMDKVIQIIGNLLENGVSSMREKNEVYFGEIGQDF